MEFINREVEFPNRKKLIVVSVNRGYDGEIESMEVEVERNEGDVTHAGTELKAEVLKAIIENMIASALS